MFGKVVEQTRSCARESTERCQNDPMVLCFKLIKKHREKKRENERESERKSEIV
jgi:hypothetical protein